MTNPIITIEETTPIHLRIMAETMSEDSAGTAQRMGITPLRALWQSYRQSIICKSVLINGNLAAIFGLSGIVFGNTGFPWLVMTPEVRRYPFKVAFIYKREIQKMQQMFPVLLEWVPESNGPSIRMLELMGFKVSKNTVRIGDEVFRKAERIT